MLKYSMIRILSTLIILYILFASLNTLTTYLRHNSDIEIKEFVPVKKTIRDLSKFNEVKNSDTNPNTQYISTTALPSVYPLIVHYDPTTKEYSVFSERYFRLKIVKNRKESFSTTLPLKVSKSSSINHTDFSDYYNTMYSDLVVLNLDRGSLNSVSHNAMIVTSPLKLKSNMKSYLINMDIKPTTTNLHIAVD